MTCFWEDLLRLVCLGRSLVTCVFGKISCDNYLPCINAEQLAVDRLVCMLANWKIMPDLEFKIM